MAVVFDNRQRNTSEIETCHRPTPTQLSILGRLVTLIESAEPAQALGGKRKVVRRQEAFAAHQSAIVSREQVEDELRRLGVQVPGQSIEGCSAHCTWR